MDIEQILALILAAEPAVLALIQAIVADIQTSAKMGNVEATPATTVDQKQMLVSLMMAHKSAHELLNYYMNKDFGVSV